MTNIENHASSFLAMRSYMLFSGTKKDYLNYIIRVVMKAAFDILILCSISYEVNVISNREKVSIKMSRKEGRPLLYF